MTTNPYPKYIVTVLAAFTVAAALFATDASAQTRPTPGCENGGCETPTPPTETNIENNVNTNVETNVENNVENTNTNTNTNNATATGGNASNSIRIEGDVTANAPMATAVSNGWVCEKRLGVSVGVGVVGAAVSGGLNIPLGNNQACIDTTYANTMVNAGVNMIINGRSHNVVVSGADAMAVGVGTMMKNSEHFKAAADHVARMNCGTVNFADRFRPNCGGVVRATAPAVRTYTK